MKKILYLLFFLFLSGCSLLTYEIPDTEEISNISDKKTVKIWSNYRKEHLLKEKIPKTDLFIITKDDPDYTVHVFSVPTGKTEGIMYNIWAVALLVSLTTIPIHMEEQIAFKIQDNKTGRFIVKKTNIIVNELYGILVPLPWMASSYATTESIIEHTWPSLYQEISKQIYNPCSELHTSTYKYTFPLKENHDELEEK